MKTGFKKILSMLLVLTMLLSMTGITAFAVNAEPLPTTLEAPSLLVYDSGDYSLYNASIQFDWRIDDGDWQYTADWDDSYFAGDYYGSIGGQRVNYVGMGYVTSYYSDAIGQALLEQDCLIETTDGSNTYYRFDTANHTLSVRARYFFTFAKGDYSDMPKVFSDCSTLILMTVL